MNNVNVTIVNGRPKGYLSLPEVAEQTGVRIGTLRQWVNRGKIPSLHIGYEGRWVHWFPESYVKHLREELGHKQERKIVSKQEEIAKLEAKLERMKVEQR